MRQPLFRFVLPAFAVAAMGFSQDAVKIERSYKSDETSAVRFDLTATAEGQEFKASGEVAIKVSKLLDGGKAMASYTAKNLRAVENGSELPTDTQPFETTVDGFGLPDSFPTKDADMVYTLASLMQLTPQKSLKVGEGFEIDWTNKAKTAKLKGKGKLLELTEVDGVKAAKLEFQFEAKPDTDEKMVTVKSTSWLETASGRILKFEGKLAIDNVQIELKAARIN